MGGNYRTLLLDRLTAEAAEGPVPNLHYPAIWPPSETVPFDCTSAWPLAVSHFEKAHGRDEIGRLHIGGEDLPPAAPPYKFSWYEWRDSGAVTGVLVHSYSEEAWNGIVLPSDKVQRMDALVTGAKWVLVAVPFAAMTQGSKRVICPDFAMVAALSPEGKMLRYMFEMNGNPLSPKDAEYGPMDLMLPGDCMTAMFFQGLLSCRNVSTEEVVPPERLSKKRVRHGGLPLLRYHTLKIRVPGTKRFIDENEIRRVTQSNIPIGLHMRRGHFKTYSAERPLLGRAVGTFYWPPALVGSLEAGAVGKTYVEEAAKENLS